jgi:hypothetical protein
MSQIRNRSAKLRPSKRTPSASRNSWPEAPAHTIAYAAVIAVAPAGVSQCSVTESVDCSTPTTSCDHRTSINGCA